MCGIAGCVNLKGNVINSLEERLTFMNKIQEHRGPDGDGKWINSSRSVGLSHTRLSIIDLTPNASQPMLGEDQNVLTFNGEIYNYKEIKNKLKRTWTFKSDSDSETILASYNKYKHECLDHLRGMFSFSLWDDKNKSLFCARDRFGIKPFYYCILGDNFYFASEAKTLVPFLDEIRTNKEALAEYLTFQYTIGEKTLFSGIKQLLPGHALSIEKGKISIWRYWDVHYDIDHSQDENFYENQLEELINDSVSLHLRSDVEVGSYVSGGVDSSLLLNLASKTNENIKGFHGRFTDYSGYDESNYAASATDLAGGDLKIADITSKDFSNNIANVIYYLDFPVAGPGSFPQYMVSELASKYLKVVFGGQGGDEIFGGYARYVIAYLEQCLNAAMDGTYKNGNYVVTIESIIPNLGLLREYKPLIKEFWKEGLFENMDKRYFRLVDRSNDMKDEINWDLINLENVFHDFSSIFNNKSNVGHEAYFDKMTHFDFKCLLPALLHVEDRMSMAHGIESRVPLLDHKVIEFAAKIPANIKFKDGNMKYMLKKVFEKNLPEEILNRRDKMGFPVPLKEWFAGDLNEFVLDTFSSKSAKERFFMNSEAVLNNFDKGSKFSRKVWGLLSLELWQQSFHDKNLKWNKKK